MKRGFAHLEAGRTADTIAISRELHALRYSGCFEIEAQALALEGAKEEAVAVLTNGLKVAPSAWLNGGLLGNYLSDLERYDEAYAAYDAALRVPDADRVYLEANHAMALHRAGRVEDARAKLQGVMAEGLSTTPELRAFVRSLADTLEIQVG